ncbi:MAG: hypothetical protein SGJ18_05140 [Pseudomonadota bacterium]|nr:hypothetical protein [Pseudomonadota bacterium]
MFSIKNQTGTSLISVMLAIGCVAIIVSASYTFILNSRKSTAMLLRTNVRDKLQSTMKMVIRLPTAIRVSHDKPGNGALKSCLRPKVEFDPTILGDCISGKTQPFNLYGPMESTGGGVVASSGMIAGTPSKPVEYNQMGSAISAIDSVAMSVTSWFTAYCPPKTFLGPPAAFCDVAEIIEVSYKIESKFPTAQGSMPQLRTVEESIVYAVKGISNRPPAIDPLVPPPPPVTPPPTVSPPIAGGGPPQVPPAPIDCPGNTVQIGPGQCACPDGLTLIRPRKGICVRLSI